MTTERIITALNDLDDSALVSVFNKYCSANNYFDDFIYSMDDFDEIMRDQANNEGPLWLTMRAFYGDFRPCDDWFRFNGYGNLQSTDYLTDWENKGYFDLGDIAKWLQESESWADYLDIEDEDED